MEENGDSPVQRSVVELQFSLSETEHPFVVASSAESCRIELEEIVPRGDGRYAEFFSVSDGDPNYLRNLGDGNDAVESHLLETYENGGLVELSVGASCPAVSLSELGALPREVVGDDGVGRIVSELPARHDPSTVVESFLGEYPGAEFVAKREKDYATPLFSCGELQQVLRNHLTDRQREVLRAAYEAGYYDWPRDCTGQAVAKELDITSATFSQHIHAAERKLLAALFDGSREESKDAGSSNAGNVAEDTAGR